MNEAAMKKMVDMSVAKQMAQQAASGGAMPNMQVVRNGSVNDAVNFAIEDFYKAAQVLKKATRNFTIPDDKMPRGMQLFITQQFFRMNAAGMMLDALGYQGATEVLTVVHADHVCYIDRTMAAWNKLINAEGDVKTLYDEIAAEEKAQANPPASMQ